MTFLLSNILISKLIEKEQSNFKFLQKVNDITTFIKSKWILTKSKNNENNPLKLLEELKSADITKRNQVLEKLEKILETL